MFTYLMFGVLFGAISMVATYVKDPSDKTSMYIAGVTGVFLWPIEIVLWVISAVDRFRGKK